MRLFCSSLISARWEKNDGPYPPPAEGSAASGVVVPYPGYPDDEQATVRPLRSLNRCCRGIENVSPQIREVQWADGSCHSRPWSDIGI